MCSTNAEGITIILLTKDKFLHFAGVQECHAEYLCFQAASHCGIGTAARHLFALRYVNSSTWISPCYLIKVEKGHHLTFEFRLRFLVPKIENLRDHDALAHDYFFHQVRSDFLKELIPEIHDSQEKILGLAVADMLRVVKENGVNRDVVEKEYKQYVPGKLLKNFFSKYFKKAALHSKLVELDKNTRVQDVAHIKTSYILQIFDLSVDYGYETYKAQIDEDGRAENVKLQVNPFDEKQPGLRIPFSDRNKDWRSVCSIEDLCFICMRQDCTVEISRRNGVPQYFKFENANVMHSFVSLLDGYYRLMEKWTFNLCKDLPSPFLLKLRALKCHGPVGKDFARRKLSDKRHNKPGCYILRENREDDSYRLDICIEGASTPASHVLLFTPDGFRFLHAQQCFATLPNLLNYYSENNDGILRECIPPSEYDISPALLCRNKSFTTCIPNTSSIVSAPLCIRNRDIKKNDSDFPGKLTMVYQGSWARSSVECVNVAVKTLKHSNDVLRMQEFLHCTNQCVFWQCETIVSMYGVVLSNPLALVMEYMALGPLDEYLSKNRSHIQEIDLVEAATYLTNAVWYLEEQRIVHGNLRCRNVFVSSHQDNSFKVKLSDPGVPSYTDDRIHWIPPECYTNYSLAKKSKAADIWALGTTLWEIFSFGDLPLPDIAPNELRMLYRGGARLSQPENCHCDIYKLMQECWSKDPSNRKKPQAVLRDINQILYEVHNSRRTHTYASLNHQGGQSLTSSMNSLSNEPTSLVTSVDCDRKNRTSIGMTMVNDEVPMTPFPQNEINLHPGLNGIELSQLTTSPSNISLESMNQWWLIEMNQLELGARLGQGFYGEVRKAVLTRWSGVEEEVAVKQLKSTGQSDGHQDLLREISIMKKLQHKNIVEIKGVVEDPRTLLVMEYVPLGSMKVYIQTEKERLSEKQLLKFALDIAEGMEYLCQKSIVHRDLAARNILVASEETVKISDFGLAQMTGHKDYYKLKTNRDLPVRWYAPETLRYWTFSSKSDVWSFGITLWEMFTYGLEPILEDCKADELLKTLESGRRLKCPSTCSMRIYTHLMWKCWEAEPKDRADFSQLLIEIKDFYENA